MCANTAGIVGADFARMRIEKDIGQFRMMPGEINVIVELGHEPPSNLFCQYHLSPQEKVSLIEAKHITPDMVKNRLQNRDISEEERDLLEEYI